MFMLADYVIIDGATIVRNLVTVVTRLTWPRFPSSVRRFAISTFQLSSGATT
jgi:hypothetical protein